MNKYLLDTNIKMTGVTPCHKRDAQKREFVQVFGKNHG